MPVDDVSFWSSPLVALQAPLSVSTKPKPPGTWLREGPRHRSSVLLVSLIVWTVVVEGSPPWVCASKEHQENVSGSTAVPPLGEPQPTVAVAETRVESCPITGANQCSTGRPPLTVTLRGSLLSTGLAAVPLVSLAVMRACAVASMSPQLPREQSWATAIAAASAPTWSRARSAYSAPMSTATAAKPSIGTSRRANTTAVAPRSWSRGRRSREVSRCIA